MNALIKSAKIIDPKSKYHDKVVDILIEKGTIKKIAAKISNSHKYKEISYKNLHVSTGWLDLRSNFCDPGHEYKEDLVTGLKAAAWGGFTAVATMPNNDPVTDSKSGIEYTINKSKENIVDVYPTGSLSHRCEGKEISEMYDMHLAGAVAFTDNKKGVDNPSLLNRALLYSKSFKGLIMNFPSNQMIANNGQINEGVTSTQIGLKGIPALAEELAVNQSIYLAEYCDSPIHLTNISTKKSVELIKKAKAKGIKITADVNSYHLLLDETLLTTFDSYLKVTPPLRTKTDINALIKGLAEGTIDVICSDHTPENIENKQCEFDHAAFGMINLQTSFSVANTAIKEKLTLEQIVETLTAQPRKILNIAQPEIKEGAIANITLFNPALEWALTEEDILSKSKNTPFIGKKLIGKAHGVINNNQLFVQ